MKKILTALIVVALLTLALVLVSCNDEGHVHDFTQTVVKPTCSLEGYTEYTCSGCDYVYRDSVLPKDAKNHSYKEYVVKSATCTETGLKCKECTACGDKVETKINKLSHSHNKDNDYVFLAPTCTEKGIMKNKCVNCDFEKSTEISPKGHTWFDWVVVAPATCDGIHGYRYHICADCGYEEGEEILPHVSADKGVVTDPTCCEVGYTTFVCDECGVAYIRNIVKPTGKHTFGSWQDHEEFENLQVRYCNNCEYYETTEKK